jgi:hypothetical protein
VCHLSKLAQWPSLSSTRSSSALDLCSASEPFHLWQTKRRPSSTLSEKAGVRQEKAQPPALRAKTTSCKPGAEDLSTRRTPLSTSSTEKWTRITRKKETNEVKARQAALLVPPPSKENRMKLVAMTIPFYPDVLFIGGRVELTLVSDDEPTTPGEEPLQRESRRRRNRRQNIR